MPIISNVHGKIADVLRDIDRDLGPGVHFTAMDFVKRYAERFPDDVVRMNRRQKAKPGAHSLEGYLDGMLAVHLKQNDGSARLVQRVGPKQYKTV